MKSMDLKNSEEHDLFGEAYRGCVEENRVRPDRSPFYVNPGASSLGILPCQNVITEG
jgi:hypothetical protein